MGKSQRRVKAPVEPETAPGLKPPTPQVIVTVKPDGTLCAEVPGGGGCRHQVQLQPATAWEQLQGIISQRRDEIEAERLALAAAKQLKRKKGQPDWRLIAKHPESEAREHLSRRYTVSVTKCPNGPGLSSSTSNVTLDEMGL